MKDTGGILPLNSQKPFTRLLVSLMVILIVSTALVGLTMIAGRVIFGIGISEIDTGTAEIDAMQRAYIKFIQAFQHISIFLAPALIIAYMMTGNISAYLKANIFPGGTQTVLVFFLALILIPLVSDLGIWNSKLILPQCLDGLESWMAAKEDEASTLTGWLIYSDNTWGLLINIIVIALLPALGEEFLFRGLFQDIFTGLFKSVHVGVLLTALLFSIFHMQFYGLVPRMVLGIVYGYLFVWSGSIWLPVIAHFINNLVPVLIAYKVGWDVMNTSVQDFIHGVGLRFIIPLALCGLIMFAIWDQRRKSNSEE